MRAVEILGVVVHGRADILGEAFGIQRRAMHRSPEKDPLTIWHVQAEVLAAIKEARVEEKIGLIASTHAVLERACRLVVHR